MLTPEDQSYLDHKHLGGTSNSKGNSYENFYSIYKIAVLLKKFPSNDETRLSAQIKDSFVDDLYISHKQGSAEFYQLKNVQTLTWQTGSSHPIEYDFRKQKELMNNVAIPFTLFLVYSNTDCNISKIPESISDCTKIEYFPYCSSLNRLLLESIEFKNAISDISAYTLAPVDKLYELSTILLGVWDSLEKKDVALIEIVQKIKGFSYIGNNFIFEEDLQVDFLARKIYDNIPNFHYMIFGSTFYWSYKVKMKGEIERGNYLVFESKVIKNEPNTFNDLELLM